MLLLQQYSSSLRMGVLMDAGGSAHMVYILVLRIGPTTGEAGARFPPQSCAVESRRNISRWKEKEGKKG